MYGSIERKTGSGPPSKITAEVKRIVEEKMREDDETTACQLHLLLTSRAISIIIVKNCLQMPYISRMDL